MAKPKTYELEPFIDENYTWCATHGHFLPMDFLEAAYKVVCEIDEEQNDAETELDRVDFITDNLDDVKQGYYQLKFFPGGEKMYEECQKGDPFAIPMTCLYL